LYTSFFTHPHKQREGRTVRARFKELYFIKHSELETH
jgi:hypothetical protein